MSKLLTSILVFINSHVIVVVNSLQQDKAAAADLGLMESSGLLEIATYTHIFGNLYKCLLACTYD